MGLKRTGMESVRGSSKEEIMF